MAEIVNLRQARKRKRRADQDEQAARNRLRHGRTGGEKAHTARTRDLEENRLEGHRRAIHDGEA